VRLSRPRVLLRAVLLAVGGSYMLWRAWEARAAARAIGGPEAALPARIALVEALVGALALVAALAALGALRRRPPSKTLRLPGPGEGLRPPPT